MNRSLAWMPAVLVGALYGVSTTALAETIRVPLRGFDEVPSVSSGARGAFRADIDTVASQISYELRYEGLQGDVRQAHVHFGQRGVHGGVSVFSTCTRPHSPAAKCVASSMACATWFRMAIDERIVPADISARTQSG